MGTQDGRYDIMPKNLSCPLGHDCDNCLWYTRIRGVNPQTGVDEDKVDCAINVIPILIIEHLRQAYSMGGALESFRNEMVNQQGNFLGIMRETVHQKLLTENSHAVENE